ncbi:hypothetical protein B0H10DRAFT_1939132 [Mycena sp. CBHHK59/15]|nr:hypothetical protein B0H10DRAFT_1939132 [Mycena sp. CBHHK59/15]
MARGDSPRNGTPKSDTHAKAGSLEIVAGGTFVTIDPPLTMVVPADGVRTRYRLLIHTAPHVLSGTIHSTVAHTPRLPRRVPSRNDIIRGATSSMALWDTALHQHAPSSSATQRTPCAQGDCAQSAGVHGGAMTRSDAGGQARNKIEKDEGDKEEGSVPGCVDVIGEDVDAPPAMRSSTGASSPANGGERDWVERECAKEGGGGEYSSMNGRDTTKAEEGGGKN